jgi:hypothetical protein
MMPMRRMKAAATASTWLPRRASGWPGSWDIQVILRKTCVAVSPECSPEF